ncbi:MAG TPA: transposase [Candidatus Eisenbacteria bacterium]|nr:transposase [Candidatus Eisenbacteria bacterium]
MARRRTRRGKRYSTAEKARILAAARSGNLTALQVQKQFGVSPLTFYRWRGPVRGRRRGRLAAAASGASDLRAQVQDRVRAVLPGVIREEVKAYLASILGRRGPGRPPGSGARRRPGRPRGRRRGPGRPRKAK